MSCQGKPPPCYQCTPPRFSCSSMHDYPPPETSTLRTSCPEPCGMRRQESSEKPQPPTFCIAGPCPVSVSGKPFCFPPVPKIKPPQTSVRFCIQTTCEGSTYCPCYKAEMPCCSSKY